MKKTTVNIEDALMDQLKEEAARRKTTMGALVDAGIRRILAEGEAPPPVGELPPLPIYDMGEPLVDIADREALYEVLDRERDERLYGTPPGSRPEQPPGVRPRQMLAVAEDVADYDAGEKTPERTSEDTGKA
ncbi:MAG: hypothetical protein OXI51_12475 [Chloroflexota bacterium]|nr:hypothetical protein [Chloroflexota bacterium]